MKNNKFLLLITGILIVLIILMSFKMYFMSVDYNNQENDLRETKKQVTILKKKINNDCNIEINDNKEPINSKNFIKTYTVLNIANSNDENYIYLTIRQFQAEEVETVKVEKKLEEDIQENNNYEFTFENNSYNVDDNIKSIFKKTKLIAIEKTDKVGLAQIQETIK